VSKSCRLQQRKGKSISNQSSFSQENNTQVMALQEYKSISRANTLAV
jgi:hypothetical protein